MFSVCFQEAKTLQLLSEMPNFPHEIIVEILARLPVKSLCRFKCVSKPWRLLISDPRFIKTHLNVTNQTQKAKLILAGNSLYALDLEQFDNGNGEVKSIEVNYPMKSTSDNYSSNFFASCNGLICIMPQPDTICVYNPCIRESKIVMLNSDDDPSLPAMSGLDYWAMHPFYAPFFPAKYTPKLYGFGYATAVDDYRFVRVRDGEVAVYSLRTSSSTGKVSKFPYNAPSVSYVSGASLNGAIHWLVSRRRANKGKYVIAAFDLAEEKFRDLPLPAELTTTTSTDFSKFTIGVLDGCMCLMHFDASSSHNAFWMMKEYGEMASWIKIQIPLPYHVLNPMCMVKNGREALLAIDQRRLVLCNLGNGMCEDVVFQAFPPTLLNSAIYVGSLVSPNMGNEV